MTWRQHLFMICWHNSGMLELFFWACTYRPRPAYSGIYIHTIDSIMLERTAPSSILHVGTVWYAARTGEVSWHAG